MHFSNVLNNRPRFDRQKRLSCPSVVSVRCSRRCFLDIAAAPMMRSRIRWSCGGWTPVTNDSLRRTVATCWSAIKTMTAAPVRWLVFPTSGAVSRTTNAIICWRLYRLRWFLKDGGTFASSITWRKYMMSPCPLIGCTRISIMSSGNLHRYLSKYKNDNNITEVYANIRFVDFSLSFALSTFFHVRWIERMAEKNVQKK